MTLAQQLKIKKSILQAKKAIKQGNTALALELYDSVLQDQPNHPIVKKSLSKLQKKLSRRQSKQTQTINPSQEQVNELINLYHSGQMVETEQACRELLRTYPQSLIIINILGAALKGQGKLQETVKAFDKVIQLKPDFAEAYSNRGATLKDLGQLEEALKDYAKAIQLKPDYAEAYYNRGNAFKEIGKRREAMQEFSKAIQLKPDYAEAYHNHADVLKDLGQLEEALESCDKAIQLRPDLAKAYYNRGVVLQGLGKIEEAVQSLHTAFQIKPASNLFFDTFIFVLNYHIPNAGTCGKYAKAQEALQRIRPKHIGTQIITDETVRQLFQQSYSILEHYKLTDNDYSASQIWRGIVANEDCQRYKYIFNTYKIIPEYCFDCYKVLIEPQTVVELFKLVLVFRNLELPRDNTRKCLIEVRPKISGAYKGLIYCRNLTEAKEILKVIQTIVNEKISEKIPVSVQRGCSEYQLAYPEFSHMEGNAFLMAYNKKWRAHEAKVDKTLVKHDFSMCFNSHNHIGFTLHDGLVMSNWLAYAAHKGDVSYLKISKE